MLTQQKIGALLASPPFFQNIFQGVRWWDEHYPYLPQSTRTALESALKDEKHCRDTSEDLTMNNALEAGLEHYCLLQENNQVAVIRS